MEDRKICHSNSWPTINGGLAYGGGGCTIVRTHIQVGMGDLGEGEEEEEGGGAGLGMGDILGGVVTSDVTVGGASGVCVCVCVREKG